MMLSYMFTYAKPFGKIIRPLRAYLEAGQRPDVSPKVCYLLQHLVAIHFAIIMFDVY